MIAGFRYELSTTTLIGFFDAMIFMKIQRPTLAPYQADFTISPIFVELAG